MRQFAAIAIALVFALSGAHAFTCTMSASAAETADGGCHETPAQTQHRQHHDAPADQENAAGCAFCVGGMGCGALGVVVAGVGFNAPSRDLASDTTPYREIAGVANPADPPPPKA